MNNSTKEVSAYHNNKKQLSNAIPEPSPGVASRLKVYTGGTFDILHPGHLFLLKQCNAIGDVTVSLNTDEFIRSYKGGNPVMNYGEREAMLLACIYVSKVVPNTGNEDSKPALLREMPNIVAIGIDWAVKDYHAQMLFTKEWLEENGMTLVYLPHLEGLSSTEIKRRVHESQSFHW